MTEYRVGSINDLKDGEMKEVAFGPGKVLLSRIDGKYYATSHLCPHYKAPMVKGVLSSDGRVMCPWHGACFRVQTGDIEDAPSLDSLTSYKVIVRGDDLYVKVTEAELKAGASGRKASCRKHRTVGKGHKVVILGGGAAGLVAAETLRSEGFAGKITIVSRESYLPIDRPKLSKAIKIDASKIALRSESDFKHSDIHILLEKEAMAVDTEKKTVTLKDNSILNYTSLIIATGGDPRVIPVQGHQLKNIFTVRGVYDSNALEKALEPFTGDKKPNVVVIGSSFIGMETASILAKQARVTVVGMEKVPFERVLGPQVGKAFMQLNEKNGVIFKMEALLDHYEPSKAQPGFVGSVVLKSGDTLPADIVVIGAGVFPQTTYLKSGSKVPLDKDGGISVDAAMTVPGVADVYAVGDIARYPYALTGEKVRIEHWNVAENQGRIAAVNVARKLQDKPLESFKQIPYFWTVQFGKSVRYAGHATSFDDVIIQGSLDIESLGFLAFYVRQGKVLAVCGVGRDPAISHASELFRVGKMPSASELKAGLDILSVGLESEEKFIVPEKTAEDGGFFQTLIVPVIVAVISFGVYWYFSTQ